MDPHNGLSLRGDRSPCPILELWIIKQRDTRQGCGRRQTVVDIQDVNDGSVDVAKQRVCRRPKKNLKLLRRLVLNIAEQINRPRHCRHTCTSNNDKQVKLGYITVRSKA